MGTFGGPIIQRETDSYGEWVKISVIIPLSWYKFDNVSQQAENI